MTDKLQFSPAFLRGDILERTEDVEIPPEVANAMFTDPPEKPVWKIKGLSDTDFAAVEARAIRQAQKLTKVLTKGSKEGKSSAEIAVDMAKESVSESESPETILVRRQMLELGCVEPKLDSHQVVRFTEIFPLFSRTLANRINALTAEGAELGESQRSTVRKLSKSR